MQSTPLALLAALLLPAAAFAGETPRALYQKAKKHSQKAFETAVAADPAVLAKDKAVMKELAENPDIPEEIRKKAAAFETLTEQSQALLTGCGKQEESLATCKAEVRYAAAGYGIRDGEIVKRIILRYEALKGSGARGKSAGAIEMKAAARQTEGDGQISKKDQEQTYAHAAGMGEALKRKISGAGDLPAETEQGSAAVSGNGPHTDGSISDKTLAKLNRQEERRQQRIAKKLSSKGNTAIEKLEPTSPEQKPEKPAHAPTHPPIREKTLLENVDGFGAEQMGIAMKAQEDGNYGKAALAYTRSSLAAAFSGLGKVFTGEQNLRPNGHGVTLYVNGAGEKQFRNGVDAEKYIATLPENSVQEVVFYGHGAPGMQSVEEGYALNAQRVGQMLNGKMVEDGTGRVHLVGCNTASIGGPSVNPFRGISTIARRGLYWSLPYFASGRDPNIRKFVDEEWDADLARDVSRELPNVNVTGLRTFGFPGDRFIPSSRNIKPSRWFGWGSEAHYNNGRPRKDVPDSKVL